MPEAGLWLAAALLLVMTAGLLALNRDHSGAPCHCLGPALESRIGLRLAVRNTVLALVAAAAAYGTNAEGPSAAELVLIVVAGVGIQVSLEGIRLLRVASDRRRATA